MDASPAKQLEGFLGKYDPEVAGIARQALASLRKRLPGTYELVYDNYNALAIAFSPRDTSAAALFSIAVYPRWVSLFFAQGARLPDPDRLLKGGGNKMRHVVLSGAKDLSSPPIEALIAAALELAGQPFVPAARRRLIIKAVAAKQRPRRAVR